MSWLNARIHEICPVISVDEVRGRVKLIISNIVAFFSRLGFEFRSFQNSDGEYTPNQMTHRARPFCSIVNERRFRPTSTHIQLRVIIFEHSDQQAAPARYSGSLLKAELAAVKLGFMVPPRKRMRRLVKGFRARAA